MTQNKAKVQIMDRKDFLITTIGCIPIQKVITDKLDIAVNEPSLEISLRNKPLKGCIEWTSDMTEIESAKNIFNHILEEQEKMALKVNKEINEYLESKINEYLNKNNLDLIDLSRDGICKRWINRREFYYKDTFIAGVEINSPMLEPCVNPENPKIEYKGTVRFY